MRWGNSGGRRGTGPSTPARATWAVVVLGLAITAVLGVLAATVNNRNENRLLNVQVREASTVLASAIPYIEGPLASGAAIAGATTGDVTKFNQYMATYVGKGQPFSYVELCAASGGSAQGIAAVGHSGSPGSSESECRFMSGSHVTPLVIVGIIDGGTRLGFNYRSPELPARYGVYAESPLPAGHRVSLPKSSAFSDLAFAFYLGPSQSRRELLESTVPLPITGRQAVATVPIANSSVTLVATPTRPLGGALSRDLALIVSIFGVLLTIGAAILTDRLVKRRRAAEDLAAENRELYAEQATIAASLQQALLPQILPEVDGLRVDARYVPGVSTMDIGGDWYDLIVTGPDRFLFVVGDVSGRGLRAAIVMASLHYAIRAYAAEGDTPEAILTKLNALLDLDKDGHFATVLCGAVNLNEMTATLSSAGHFAPMMLATKESRFIQIPTGPPIGSGIAGDYASSSIPLPDHGTLVAFTDGLIERRGEPIDVGLARLLDTAVETTGSLDVLMDTLVDRLLPDGSTDDAAVLGMRWKI